MFRLGVIINPVAGIGGRVALKGSDGEDIQQQALARGATPMAQSRMQQALQLLLPYKNQLHILTAAAEMGESLCQQMGFQYEVIQACPQISSAMDTEQTVQRCLEQGIDILLFAGGDGTARNVYTAMQSSQLRPLPAVIGVPAGCKIHSSVYAVTPTHAGELLALLLKGRALSLMEASVMDIDENAFRQDRVKARLYGHLDVPAENRFMQSMKEGGIRHEALALEDIAAFMVETMEDDCLYFIGSGTTPRAIMENLQLPATLLGVDAVYQQQLVASDLGEQDILSLLNEYPKARFIMTVIGGQGHVFGRGNQQVSPAVINQLGMENIDIIATAEKIHSLNGQPLRVDTGDQTLNQSLYGMVTVITGYDEKMLYRIAP